VRIGAVFFIVPSRRNKVGVCKVRSIL
jgi:hypothetical protein